MARYAAVDIGSNSIRMQAAEVVPGQPPKILGDARDVTRLGESVFRSGLVSPEAMEFSCGVLARMAEIYSKFNVVGVRAVATSAVRDARNQTEFIARASAALHTPVEIISGQEEARLIHLGVQSRWPHPNQRILIIDVGGGSAEVIYSDRGTMVEAFSKQVGAVRLSEVFLKNDPPSALDLHRMHDFIAEKLSPALRRLRELQVDRAIGTSATAAALASAIHRIPRDKRDAADRLRAPTTEIRKLFAKLAERDLAGRRKMTGIGPRRAEVIVPGVALILQVLDELRLPAIHYSAAGVRDGLIADLAQRGLGREYTQMSRDQRRTVEEMAKRYGVSLKHARKVAGMAQALFNSLHPIHRLAPGYGKLLEAAAYLHDIGHYVSDTRHHKHSYYLVANSDMPGFTDREREIVANLCRYHRKAPPAAVHGNYQSLKPEEQHAVVYLMPLLRLADGLDRSHEQRVENVSCHLRNGQVHLQLQSSSDIDLEQWAGESTAGLFQSIYSKRLVVERVKE
jgi:exopolyphosphatase / guanosine-5'-triphosphate,3'-diphosphate pyrophosphatase